MASRSSAEQIEALATLAAERRATPLTYVEKQALSASNVLGGLGSAVKDNPELSHALIGAGVGAGIGGIGQGIANIGRDKIDKRSLMSSALTGGLAGGAIGGGAGLLRRGIGGFGAPSSGATTSFVDPKTGQKMQIDPAALKQNPQLADKARELAKKPVDGGMTSSLIGKALGSTSAKILPAMGVADWATRTFNTGERFGYGKIRPQFSTNPEDLIRGMEASVPGKANALIPGGVSGEFADTVIKGQHTSPDAHLNPRTVAERLHNAGVNRDVPLGTARVTGSTSNASVAEQLGQRSLIDPPGASWWSRLKNRIGGNYGDGADPTVTFQSHNDRVTPETLTRDQTKNLKAKGYAARDEFSGKDKTPRDLHQGLFGQRARYSKPAAIGSRLAAYGAVPAVEYLLRNHFEQSGKQDELRKMMEQYAKPVGDP